MNIRHIVRVILAIALGIAALHLGAASDRGTLSGRVIGVSDGDTLTLLDAGHTQHRIRLAGIDAPEKGQPHGQQCKQSLSDLAFGRDVTVEWDKHDRYGRVLGKVHVGDIEAGLEQVRRGCAWHYKKYENEQALADREAYAAAEMDARAGRRGLWVDEEPMAPWVWRHPERSRP